LGNRLTPRRDRKMIMQALRMEGNPGKRPDGYYHVPSWQTFMAQAFESRAKEGKLDERVKEELRGERLKNEKLEIAVKHLRGELMEEKEVVEVVVGAFSDLFNQFRNQDDTLSTKLTGIDAPGTVKKRLQEERRSTMLSFANADWAPKKKAFWRRVSAQLRDRLPKLLPGLGASAT
jgi:hypothetical protein